MSDKNTYAQHNLFNFADYDCQKLDCVYDSYVAGFVACAIAMLPRDLYNITTRSFLQ